MNIANDMQYVQDKNGKFFHVSNRRFHKNPELSFQEVETARRFAE